MRDMKVAIIAKKITLSADGDFWTSLSWTDNDGMAPSHQQKNPTILPAFYMVIILNQV